MTKIKITSELIDELKLKIKNHHQDDFKFASHLYNNQDASSDYIYLTQLAILYSKLIGNIKSNYKKALLILNKAATNPAIIESDYITRGELAFYLGINHHFLGHYVDAFYQYNRSIEFFEKVDNLPIASELNIANALVNIGALHNLNDYEEYNNKDINRALQIYTKHQAKFGIGNCYNLFGAYALKKHKYNECVNYYKKYLSINIETNNETGIAVSFINLACYYCEREDFKNSLIYFKKSYEKLELLKNDFLFALHDKMLADFYLASKDLKKAVTYYRKALDFFEAREHIDELIKIYKGLADTYAKTNQYKKAFFYLEKHIETKKTAFHFDKVSALHKVNKS